MPPEALPDKRTRRIILPTEADTTSTHAGTGEAVSQEDAQDQMRHPLGHEVQAERGRTVKQAYEHVRSNGA